MYSLWKGIESLLGIMRLSDRREAICLKFAKNCLRMDNFKRLFPMHISKHEMKTRHEEKYNVSKINGKRYSSSAIPNMLRLLNKECKEKKEIMKNLKKSFLSPTNFACNRIYCWDNKPIIIIINLTTELGRGQQGFRKFRKLIPLRVRKSEKYVVKPSKWKDKKTLQCLSAGAFKQRLHRKET